MKRISKDYDSHTKDELLTEAAARGIEDVSASSLKEDIVAALALNDETPPDQPPSPLPPLVASPIPQVKPPEPSGADSEFPFPKDEEFTGGLYVNKFDKLEYALCIHPANRYGKTHTLKNSHFVWTGTEEEFNGEFTHKKG